MTGRFVGLPRRRGRPGDTAEPAVGSAPACHAPARALYVFPDGAVRSCCVNTLPLGNVRRQGLAEIWSGAGRSDLVERMGRHDFSAGCASCGAEIAVEGASSAYPRQFDEFAADGPTDWPGWPATLGLYLANTCNLQCVQCHGGWSSSIRKHREGRPPIRTRYDDAFFADLAAFLPHLQHLLIAGGEPFLIPEAFRTWSLVAELAPDLDCTVITNGTQWNDRVAAALDGIRTSVVVSIDGATAPTFESIRVGARFADVMAHLDRFGEYTRSAGTRLTINFCLMANNFHEFADLLVLAEERGIHVDVSVVREPDHVSLAKLSRPELQRVHDRLIADRERLVGRLPINLPTFDAELGRIAAWLEAPDVELAAAGGPSSHTILMFRREAPGGRSDALAQARAELDSGAGGRRIHEVTVGLGDRIVGVSSALGDDLGIADDELLGRPAADLWTVLSARLGRSTSLDETPVDGDRTRFAVTFPGHEVAAVAAAVRDPSGRADEARIVFAIDPRPAP